jgi:hypothetical protein
MTPFFRRSKKEPESSNQTSATQTEGAPTAEAEHEPAPTTGHEETSAEGAEQTSSAQGSPASRIDFRTTAGVVAFLAGGLGTIIAAIGDFGSDSGALAAARRNHVLLLTAAAAAAALGLACGALYTILKGDKKDDSQEKVSKAKNGSKAKSEIETTKNQEASAANVPVGWGLMIAGLIALLGGSRKAKNGATATSGAKAKSEIETTKSVGVSDVNLSVGWTLMIAALIALGASGSLLGFGYPVWASVVALVGLLCLVLALTMWKRNVKLTQPRVATGFLIIGVLAVSAGVALGVVATSDRKPGRPQIEVMRVDDKTILVKISAEGLPSNDWYEASVSGYDDLYTASSEVPLVTARFSPGQDGKLDWTHRVNAVDGIPVPVNGMGTTKISRVLVRLAHGALSLVGYRNCNRAEVTCLAVRVPITIDPSATTFTTTTSTSSTSTPTTTTTTARR